MKARLPLISVLIVSLLWATFASLVSAQGTGSTVHVASLRGTINPSMANYIQRTIDDAERAGAHALVIEMDTPGGLMTSMRDITGAILNAEVPVVVYVSPPGARAASAGVFVTMSAHVAAMAPNTNIGSAHPVSLGEGQEMDETMAEKVVNDAVAQVKDMTERRGRNAEWAERAVRESANITSTEALDLNVVDYLANDLPSLLDQIDGTEVELASGRTVTLATRNAMVVPNGMNAIESFLHAISDPTIAYILLALGVNGLLFELASPGAILPGVAGLVLILLAFYSLGTLPINLTGVLLTVVGFALLGAEIFTPGFGAFGIGGVVALLLGSMILMQSSAPFLAVSPVAVALVVISTLLFFFVAIRGVLQSRRNAVTTGREGLVGAVGTVRQKLDPVGQVFVDGELWEAATDAGPVAVGTRVRVLAIKGLRLIVAPEDSPAIENTLERVRKQAEQAR